MERNKPKTTPDNAPEYGDKKAAAQLAQGLTPVPYWAYNPQGKRAAYCKWVQLRPGETVADAAKRLSVPAPEPAWTPELKAKVARLLQAIGQR